MQLTRALSKIVRHDDDLGKMPLTVIAQSGFDRWARIAPVHNDGSTAELSQVTTQPLAVEVSPPTVWRMMDQFLQTQTVQIGIAASVGHDLS